MCGGGGRDDHDPDDPDNLGPRARKLIRKEDVAPWTGDYGRWNFQALAHPLRALVRVGSVS